MAIHFNHTILSARDSRTSAIFLAEMLGLPAPTRWGPFQIVTTENGANLDYMDVDGAITPQHYAFLISEPEFDEIFARIRERKLPYWADPGQTRPGKINHHDGGRGVYFEDPNGHFLETSPGPTAAAAGIRDAEAALRIEALEGQEARVVALISISWNQRPSGSASIIARSMPTC